MKMWKVAINLLEDDQPLDTYYGVAQDAKQAVELAKERVCVDRVADVRQAAESESMSDEEIATEIATETQLELYASEVVLIGDVEFGI